MKNTALQSVLGLVLTVNAVGCSTVQAINRPDGSAEYLIACGADLVWSICINQAKEACPGGYTILSQVDGSKTKELRVVCSRAPTPGQAVPAPVPAPGQAVPASVPTPAQTVPAPVPAPAQTVPAPGPALVEDEPALISTPPEGRAEIQKVINENIVTIQHCYERQLAQHPRLSGKVKVRWVIDKSGAVRSVRQSSGDLKAPEVISCILAEIRTWHFSAPPKGEAIVDYPFLFKSVGF